jgi:tetratricopeptide (TPR) repeat protein
MRRVKGLLFIFLVFSPIISIAEIKTYTHTIKQPFGGSQAPDDARVAAITRAKREVLEQAGTYLESLTVVKNGAVAKDEIFALAAGVLKATVVSQKNYATEDAFGIIVVAKVEVDTTFLENRIKKLLQDRTLLKKYKVMMDREKELLGRIESLEELAHKQTRLPDQGQCQRGAELKNQFREITHGLTAIDWKQKALALWRDGEYVEPAKALDYLDHAIRINPDDPDAYISRGMAYANLGRLDRMCTEFQKACDMGNCNALQEVKQKGDCR